MQLQKQQRQARLVPIRVTDPGEAVGRPRIAIVTSGRFHVLDLARELHHRGYPVAFYSLVPPWRCRRFGLPDACCRWMLPYCAASALAVRLTRRTRWFTQCQERLIAEFDRAVSARLEPCDVLIGMSGMVTRTAQTAKRKFQARIIIERSSRHIESQQEILRQSPDGEEITDATVGREKQDYELADRISVLSEHCRESFLERGFPAEKVVRTLPGVDLKMFPPTPAPDPNRPTIIFIGKWSYQKGCDILLQAWKQLPGIRLIHLGTTVPDEPHGQANFEARGQVNQFEIPRHLAESHVLVLPSRQEGLATVLCQALACGVRVVCSTRTGGQDLQELVANPSAIRVVPVGDVPELVQAIQSALSDALSDQGMRDLLKLDREKLSWASYAQRYESLVQSLNQPVTTQ